MDVLGTLRRYGIRPSKGLGQNLLVDEAILDAIVQGSGVGSEDLVLEIGPGLGTLTRRLASKANQVVAVELDRRMVSILESELAETDNVRIVQGDILELAPSELLAEELATHSGYSVVANLPYYITSAALRHLLTGRRPERMTVMVQREVAERIMAQPGKLSLLALSVQVFGAPQLVCARVSRKSASSCTTACAVDCGCPRRRCVPRWSKRASMRPEGRRRCRLKSGCGWRRGWAAQRTAPAECSSILQQQREAAGILRHNSGLWVHEEQFGSRHR